MDFDSEYNISHVQIAGVGEQIDLFEPADEVPNVEDAAVSLACVEHLTGNVQIFVQGKSTIEIMTTALKEKHGVDADDILTYHSRMFSEEKAKIESKLRSRSKGFILICTDALESGVTLNVHTVILTCIRKSLTSFEYINGLDEMIISYFSALQQIGRVGRRMRGRAISLKKLSSLPHTVGLASSMVING